MVAALPLLLALQPLAFGAPLRSIAPRAPALSTLRSARVAGPVMALRQDMRTGPEIRTGVTAVMPEDYRLALLCLLPGTDLMLRYHQDYGFLGGFILFALGLIFAVQTMRVRFVCTKDSFTIMKKAMGGNYADNSIKVLRDQGDNVVVGGKSKWMYKDFVNYEFFPKGCAEAGLPCALIYFKETATPQAKASGPGKILSDLSLKLHKNAVPGQVHFAPAMCDCRELDAHFKARGAKKICH